MGKIVSSVGEMLMGKTPAQPDIPTPEIPAAPAPSRRDDTGASVVIGSDAANKNARVSGKKSTTGSGGSGDVLGGLGRGGLSI